tara:strand:- start:245698 stop:247176 length:1479 start_codon:yes stop_codon:yes gene_type:complete
MIKIISVLVFMLISTDIYSQTQIDILVLFSNDATSASNQADAQLYIDTLNQSFTNSNINVTAALSGAVHINYDDNTTLDGDLNWLNPPNPPTLVSNLRDDYGADLVILIVENNDFNNNGLAKVKINSSEGIPELDSDFAYAVVAKNKAVNPANYTFSHEVGHLIGLVHANEILRDDNNNITSYSYRGHETNGCSNLEEEYPENTRYTIMTTQNEADGLFSEKVNYWSDPQKILTFTFESSPERPLEPAITVTCESALGSSGANSRSGWITNASTVAAYKSLPTPTNLSVSAGSGFGEPYLTWDFNPTNKFDNYRVYRKRLGTNNQNCSNGSLSNYCFIGSTTSKNYTDWDVYTANGTSDTFYYTITAVIDGTESEFSNLVSYDGEFSNFKINDNAESIPSNFSLKNNYPNPFNPSTTISFALPEKSEVRINVYNINGQLVSSLVNEVKPAGTFDIDFEASGLASGVYIARMTAIGEQSGDRFSKHIKMQLIK